MNPPILLIQQITYKGTRISLQESISGADNAQTSIISKSIADLGYHLIS
jgi:hypothetical protein